MNSLHFTNVVNCVNKIYYHLKLLVFFLEFSSALYYSKEMGKYYRKEYLFTLKIANTVQRRQQQTSPNFHFVNWNLNYLKTKDDTQFHHHHHHHHGEQIPVRHNVILANIHTRKFYKFVWYIKGFCFNLYMFNG